MRNVEHDWGNLLTQWNRALLECEAIVRRLPLDVVRAGWLGFPPATEAQILDAERRLGATFPPSYRAFLRFTNGWRRTGFFIDALLPVDDVDWYRARHQDAIDAWIDGVQSAGPPIEVRDEEYFVYGAEQDSSTFRDRYLQTALQVSAVYETNVYLLNPRVVFPDGEWEAWFHAHWAAGAVRHRSFWELMRREYDDFLRMQAGQLP